jgi:hypothetical protein
MNVLTINGKHFAQNDAEFLNSLFNAGGTCSGYYKKLKRGIRLYNMQKELFAFVVNNRHSERFFVSASIVNGKPWYMYALTDKDKHYLELDTVSFSGEAAIASILFEAHSRTEP